MQHSSGPARLDSSPGGDLGRERLGTLAGSAWGLVAVAALTFVLRMAYLGAPLGPDEAGFLIVAQHWRDAGDQIYGPYWVDRPPLLIGLFDLGDRLGGVIGLRVLGGLAAGATVLCVGRCVRRVRGPRAGVVAGAVAGALLLVPQIEAYTINGELLAAPFIAGGTWAAVVAVTTPGRPARLAAALAVGATTAAAVMVKQNMVDAGVFAVVLAVVAAHRGLVRPAAVLELALAALAGALAVASVTFVVGGTSLDDLVYAMYGFRVDAVGVAIDDHHDTLAVIARAVVLEGATLGPVVLVLLVVLLARRRFGDAEPVVLPVVVATVALTTWVVASIAAGGQYWPHYLLQLVVPTALAAGLVVTPARSGRTSTVAAVVAVGLASWTVGLLASPAAGGQVNGQAVGDAALPGDTIVVVFGGTETLEASGLPTPYPYIWKLPSRTLDPDTAELAAVLTRDRPTWLVVRDDFARRVIADNGTTGLITRDYRLVATVCRREVYLRVGLTRAVPTPDHTSCRLPLAPWLR